MILEAATEEGGLYGVVDNPRDPCRYIVNFLRRPDGTEAVMCVLGTTPEFDGPGWTLPGPAGARHEFVLVWTPATATADLFVDGVKRISGYQGSTTFRYGRGVQIGASRYRSERASGVFWKIRFEIG